MIAVARREPAGNAPFKPHALLRAEAARADCLGEADEEAKRRRLTEEQQWRANVIDLHRVHALAQSLFILLEHNNEALIRVALEIVMCPEASKVLWWHEGWYADDERREYFRKIVKDKLSLCLNGRDYVTPLEEEEDGRVEKAEYEALKARLSLVEGQYESSERAKRVAESRCGELETSLCEVSEKMKTIEKTSDELRKSIREKDETLRTLEAQPKEDPSSVGKISGLEQQVKILEEARNKANKELENRSKSLDDLEKRLEDTDRQLSEQKSITESTEKELNIAKKKAEDAEATLRNSKQIPVQTKHTGKESDKINALMAEAEAERRRAAEATKSAEKAKEELVAKEHELAEALKNLKLMESRWKEAETRANDAEKDISNVRADAAKTQADMNKALAEAKGKAKTLEQNDSEDKRKAAEKEELERSEKRKQTQRREQGVPHEEHERIMGELSKAKEKNAEIRKELFDLKGNNADLQDKNDRMLKMLHEIKEQLARVTAIAEKKGLGKAVGDILKESKVTETLESDEYTCFNRLYDDAKRRQEKQRKLQEQKLGIRSTLSPSAGYQPRHSARGTGSDSARRLSSPAIDPTVHESSPPQYFQDGHYHHRPSVQGAGAFGGISGAPTSPSTEFAYYGTLAAKGGFALAAQRVGVQALAAKSLMGGTFRFESEGNEVDAMSKAMRRASGGGGYNYARPASSQGQSLGGLAIEGFNTRATSSQNQNEASQPLNQRGNVSQIEISTQPESDSRKNDSVSSRPETVGRSMRTLAHAASFTSSLSRDFGSISSVASASAMVMDTRTADRSATTNSLPQDSESSVPRRTSGEAPMRRHLVGAQPAQKMNQRMEELPPLPFERAGPNISKNEDDREGLATSPFLSSVGTNHTRFRKNEVDREGLATSPSLSSVGTSHNRLRKNEDDREGLATSPSLSSVGTSHNRLRKNDDDREGLATSPSLPSVGTNHNRLRTIHDAREGLATSPILPSGSNYNRLGTVADAKEGLTTSPLLSPIGTNNNRHQSMDDVRRGLATSPFLSSIGTNSRLRGMGVGPVGRASMSDPRLNTALSNIGMNNSMSDPRFNTSSLTRKLASSGEIRKSPREVPLSFPSPGRRWPNRGDNSLLGIRTKKDTGKGGPLDDWTISGMAI